VFWPIGDVRLVGLGHQGRPLHGHADRLGSIETTLTVLTYFFGNPMTVLAAWLTVEAM
jgi:hypothetical protein